MLRLLGTLPFRFHTGLVGPRRGCTIPFPQKLTRPTRPVLCNHTTFRMMSETAATAKGGADLVDLAWPSARWSEQSKKLFQELYSRKDITHLKHEVYHTDNDNRLFTRCDKEQTGNFFNYAFFFNETKRELCGVLQFGPYTEGPRNCAHGGAIATMCDAIMGKLIYRCGYTALTANLSVDYKALITLGGTYYIQGLIEKVDGRKIWASCQILSSNKQTVSAKATSLFLLANKEDKPQSPI